MRVAILHSRGDASVDQGPALWAIGRLREVLEDRGVEVIEGDPGTGVDGADRTVLVADVGQQPAVDLLTAAQIELPDAPESLALLPVRLGNRPALLATAADSRGMVYAALELADRVACSTDPLNALDLSAPVIEQPLNRIRSVTRLFASEPHDKPWFHDREFWTRYLAMLATQRFNRFSLTLGLGYNFPWFVTDAYFYFAYPFLVDGSGYDVRVPQISAAERDLNLEMLRFASEETVRRGMEFQLGLWTHAYEWFDSPAAQHTVEGLTEATHAPYCRDALQALLEACPAIGGVTLRTHGESGVRERSWEFWQVVLDGIARVDRPVGIDLHAKGLDEQTLDIARATGQPVTVSPKYWAEHMGLPYHQAGIREMERPQVDLDSATGKQEFMRVSEGSRPFTRYGYGDFLRENRDYDILFRIWPGTQRLLLWGDPAMAAGYGRWAGIAGSAGLEWMEPLTFKGREGSGDEGSRDGYADPSLSTSDDWEKYEYSYRLFGRLSYDPDADPEQWRRWLRSRYGPAASDAEQALGAASRILPLVTTAYHPSASNNYYWPELYINVRIVWREGDPPTHLHFDTPAPDRFGTVSPLDPELFAGLTETVDQALSGSNSGRYTLLDVSRWLEDLADEAAGCLAGFEAASSSPADAEARRLGVDVSILIGLGRFFVGQIRAAAGYELYLRLGNRSLLDRAVEAYGRAREAWAAAARSASGVYRADLSFGPQEWLRGHWSDRLAAIDADIEAMRALADSSALPPKVSDDDALALLRGLEAARPTTYVGHTPRAGFRRGVPHGVVLDVGGTESGNVTGVRLRFRRMDQSLPYEELPMERVRRRFVAWIPADYLDSPYPIQYHFVVEGSDTTWLHPGLGPDLSAQPYFVIRQER